MRLLNIVALVLLLPCLIPLCCFALFSSLHLNNDTLKHKTFKLYTLSPGYVMHPRLAISVHPIHPEVGLHCPAICALHDYCIYYSQQTTKCWLGGHKLILAIDNGYQGRAKSTHVNSMIKTRIESISRSSVGLTRYICSSYLKNIQRHIFLNSVNYNFS